jgi:predicted porin
MRRILLGTTALALLSTTATAADRISLSLGGYFRGYLVAGSMDDGPGEAGSGVRAHGIARESEIHFKGSTTLDNGLKVGVTVELEGETSADQIDESYVWFEGGWGRLEVGSEDPPGEQMWIGAPTVLNGHGYNSPTFFDVPNGTNAIGNSSTTVTITFDRDKVVYFTPRFVGFQFGISYTPDRTEELGFGLRPDNNAGQQSEAVEMAANWNGSLAGAKIAVMGAYGTANVEAPPAGVEDQDIWGAGINIGYAGFTLGAGYRWNDLGLSGPNNDRIDWNVGLKYSWSAWSVAGNYGRTEAEAGAAGGEDTLDVAELGVSYGLGPGITLMGGLQYVDFDDNLGAPGAENTAWLGLLGTRLSF